MKWADFAFCELCNDGQKAVAEAVLDKMTVFPLHAVLMTVAEAVLDKMTVFSLHTVLTTVAEAVLDKMTVFSLHAVLTTVADKCPGQDDCVPSPCSTDDSS